MTPAAAAGRSISRRPDADVRELLDRYRDAVEHPLPWQEVAADAPVQQIVERPPDLTRLPVPTRNEHDSGPYVSVPAAVAIGVDPCTLLASQAITPIDFDEVRPHGRGQRRGAGRQRRPHAR